MNRSIGTLQSGGSIDAEPGYDPPYGSTRDFVDAYNQNTGLAFYDFGSAEQGVWTNAQLWHVSYSGVDYPVPEIKSCCESGQIANWLAIDEYAKTNGKGYTITGTIDNYHAGFSCNDVLKPNEAWTDMLNAIQGDAGAYYQSTIQYSLNLPCG